MTLSPLILIVCVVVFAATIIALALSLVWNNKLIGSNEQYLRERDFYREQLERTCDLITNALRRQVEGLDEELRSYRAAFSGRPDIQAEAFKRMAEDMRTLSIIVDYAEATPRWNLFQLLADIRTRLTIVRVVLSGSPALSEEMRERTDLARDFTQVETDEVHSWFSFSSRSSAAECSEQYATAGSSQPLHPISFVELYPASN